MHSKLTKALAFCALFTLMSTSAFAATTFPDVDSGTDYQSSILWMAENGVINGHADGYFRPEDCVNRAEMLKMAYIAAQKRLAVAAGPPDFPDVDDADWFYPYVRYGQVEAGIEGYQDGYFRPERCVSRAEAIKITYYAFLGDEPIHYDENSYLLDDIVIPQDQWFTEIFSYALARNLVGRNHAGLTGAYQPNNAMNRQEVAEMLYRFKAFYDNLSDEYITEISPIEIGFAYDNCDSLNGYVDQPWFDDLNDKYGLYISNLDGNVLEGGLGGTNSEGCLALDGSHFIFIPEIYEQGCSQIFAYDTAEGALTKAYGEHCASEFGPRVGAYVEFYAEVESDQADCTYNYKGQYFYQQDEVRSVNKELVCQ